MKNIPTILLAFLLLLGGVRLNAQSNEEIEAQANEVAMAVLNAYKNRDLKTAAKLLKDYMAGKTGWKDAMKWHGM
jgi:hypothetical protein